MIILIILIFAIIFYLTLSCHKPLIFIIRIFSLFFSRYRVLTNSIQLNTWITPLFKSTFKLSHNFTKLPEKPTIFIANPPSNFFEKITPSILPTNMEILTTEKWHPSLINTVSNDKVQQRLDEGISIFSYEDEEALRLAQQLNVTVTPIVFDNITTLSGKYSIIVGDTFHVSDPQLAHRKLKHFFNKAIRLCRKTKNPPSIPVSLLQKIQKNRFVRFLFPPNISSQDVNII